MNKPNKLIHEKSPYLLQHAYNPIFWYPWSKEAFNQAKTQDKLIFLSIGYGSCHWCHVMERESFNNERVASYLNQYFICIKVDREELPEVDSLYMDFAQMMMSSGAGWPLNLILTPELKPFYAVTYLPPFNLSGMMGLVEMSTYIHNLWRGGEKEKILAQAEEAFFLFNKITSDLYQKGQTPDQALGQLIYNALMEKGDLAYGGKKGEPKFPYSYQIEFLFDYSLQYKIDEAKKFACLTLDRMAQGGIYDHVFGGFCRYCIDDKWMIPHFEKMLCDNALIAEAFLIGYQNTKNHNYSQITQEILDFIIEKFRSEEGGFYSSIDADCEGQEGFYDTFTYQELVENLDDEKMKFVEEFYNVTEEGNFEGRNVFYQSLFLEEFAKEKNVDTLYLQNLRNSVKDSLRRVRKQIQEPKIDQKIITSWNALAINVMLKAGMAFKHRGYIETAKSALSFLLSELFEGDVLYRRYIDRERKYLACLDDYAYLIKALLSCYRFGKGKKYLDKALFLAKKVMDDFSSEFSGFYFSSKPIAEDFPRKIDFQDGAEPSANSVLIEVFFEIYLITSNRLFLNSINNILEGAEKVAKEHPLSFVYFGKSLLRYLQKNSLILVIVLDEENRGKESLIDWMAQNHLPNLTCIWKQKDDLDFHLDKTLIDGQTAFYLCSQNKCFSPFVHLDDVKKIISSL